MPVALCFLEHDRKLTFEMIVDLLGCRKRVNMFFPIQIGQEEGSEDLNVLILILEIEFDNFRNIIIRISHQPTDRVNHMNQYVELLLISEFYETVCHNDCKFLAKYISCFLIR